MTATGQLPCGCILYGSAFSHGIRWCPTHAAAPKLLAALEAIFDGNVITPAKCEQARAAIAQVKGG
jgi:hypothetical protein